jgi:hypothetical protein
VARSSRIKGGTHMGVAAQNVMRDVNEPAQVAPGLNCVYINAGHGSPGQPHEEFEN